MILQSALIQSELPVCRWVQKISVSRYECLKYIIFSHANWKLCTHDVRRLTTVGLRAEVLRRRIFGVDWCTLDDCRRYLKPRWRICLFLYILMYKNLWEGLWSKGEARRRGSKRYRRTFLDSDRRCSQPLVNWRRNIYRSIGQHRCSDYLVLGRPFLWKNSARRNRDTRKKLQTLRNLKLEIKFRPSEMKILAKGSYRSIKRLRRGSLRIHFTLRRVSPQLEDLESQINWKNSNLMRMQGRKKVLRIIKFFSNEFYRTKNLLRRVFDQSL